jgi:hypothetical protein
MLRDERTPGARKNQRIVLPLMLLAALVAIVGVLVASTALFVIGAVLVLLGALAWRWI